MSASARRPFRFTHRWVVPRPAAEVAALLADPLGYPTWWPSVPRARRIDGAGHDGDPHVAVLLRGLIPVRLVMARELDDRERGRLVARLDGDLRGTVRVTVHDDDGPAGGTGGCTVAWEQEVVLGAGRLRAAARLPGARAAMRLSHAWAMRSARRALGARALPAGR
ncbi:SRPBCC family protein [Micrococcus endophyticus]|uniref:SRPBCC family protein n=1 Tax=Micrococcus endophyticus TaxID=455343 RepID=UPI0035A834FB